MTREEFLRNKILEKYSLRAFADLIGMPHTTLNSILKNTNGASVANLKKICNGLGITLDYLANFDDNAKEISISTPPKPNDLNKFLQQSQVIFDGETYSLDDEDRELIMKSLEFAFTAAKQANKRKK
ncbi:helix-turn-helix domain-containing protein [Veillonella magna]|uniref:helix-turn-helix domain-containing protein n=1 Tax=Veillonella magna TaxID=464322 RepID=UPI000402F366|nr:helix-turn-helix transcriptional regulator [Veillonella magna]